jgi:hypothetical protein
VCRELQGVLAVADAGAVVASQVEVKGDQVADRVFILDDQHARSGVTLIHEASRFGAATV